MTCLPSLKRLNLCSKVFVTGAAGQSLAYRQRDIHRFQSPVRWKQTLPVFSAFAYDSRCIGHTVENFTNLLLDKTSLFFNNDKSFQALREAAAPIWLKRPGHSDFIEFQAQGFCPNFVDIEL